MKTYNEEAAHRNMYCISDWPLYVDHLDSGDKEYNQDDEDENADWGNIDPDGGDEPTSPGSAV
jgi:hypothetical protein